MSLKIHFHTLLTVFLTVYIVIPVFFLAVKILVSILELVFSPKIIYMSQYYFIHPLGHLLYYLREMSMFYSKFLNRAKFDQHCCYMYLCFT